VTAGGASTTMTEGRGAFGVVAQSFGGGGHKHASGLSVAGTIEDLLPRIVEAFAPDFPET